MSDLIFFYDGMAKQSAQLVVVLAICALALVMVFDDRCHFWKDEEDDED